MNNTLPLENVASSTLLPNYRAAARALATRIVQAAAAGGAVLAAAPAAHADIIYSGPLNVTATISLSGVYFDPDDFTSSGAPFAGWAFNPFFQPGTPSMFLLDSNTNRGITSSPLAYGTAVGTSSFVSTTYSTLTGFDSTPRYIGTSFTGDDAQLHYGWMQLSWNVGGMVTIHSAAYNSTPSGAINAGQTVPEASHAALLLGAGAAGLLFLRKRQQSLRPAA